MKVVVAGGSGALGRRLCEDLTLRGHEVVVLTRRVRPGSYRQVEWDGRTVGPWAAELEGSAVVNLAGELVDRRPTPANTELLTRSRVEPTRALVSASKALTVPVPVLVQASTLAIYGDAGDAVLTEESPPADGPPQMAGVARAWEAAARGAHSDRTVVLRTGIVLDADTPALDRLLGLARWGLGGRVGSGRQWVSWVHVDDWLAIVREALSPGSELASGGVDQSAGVDRSAGEDRSGPVPLSGVVHATGPEPVRNADLMAALRRVLHRPAAPPTPELLVRLGALVLRTDPALALTGRRALPARLTRAGFRFEHPQLDEALADLLAR